MNSFLSGNDIIFNNDLNYMVISNLVSGSINE